MMKRLENLFLITVLAILSVGCGNNSANNEQNVSAPVPRTSPPKDLRLQRFDLLEKIFQNENWLVVNGNDSSYLYCSRLGEKYFKTYEYKMLKGDSVQTIVSEIKLAADTIAWRISETQAPVYLNKISDAEAVWADYKNLNFFVFHQIDSNHIRLQLSNGESRTLAKTITLSSFLVKSKYDYLHGTRLAFELNKH